MSIVIRGLSSHRVVIVRLITFIWGRSSHIPWGRVLMRSARRIILRWVVISAWRRLRFRTTSPMRPGNKTAPTAKPNSSSTTAHCVTSSIPKTPNAPTTTVPNPFQSSPTLNKPKKEKEKNNKIKTKPNSKNSTKITKSKSAKSVSAVNQPWRTWLASTSWCVLRVIKSCSKWNMAKPEIEIFVRMMCLSPAPSAKRKASMKKPLNTFINDQVGLGRNYLLFIWFILF